MDDKATLTDAVGNELLPFDVDGVRFYIRQPSPEEYDDAMSLQRLHYQKTLNMAHVKEVADTPCSEGERMIFQAMLEDTQARFDAAEDGPNKRALADELVRLENELRTRTLAEEAASDAAALRRDRWLCAHLLCDANGKPFFDTTSKDFERRWNKLAMKVKNEARPFIWHALTLVREAPFSSDL